jgi:hypothetical protein
VGLKYERLVAEDFHFGYGTTDVTMPAGGTATGTKVGLSTFKGGWVNAKLEFGAVGDGSVNDAAAIQAALDTNLNVYVPFGDYFIGNTTLTMRGGQTLAGAGIGSDLTFRTRLLYSGNSHAILDEHPVNTSGYGQRTIEDLYIVGSGAASTGAGIALLAGGFAFYNIRRCRIGGTFKYGLIGDGIICANIYENIFENGRMNGVHIQDSAHIWIVNGDDLRASQVLGFSNVLRITDNQFNGAYWGVVDDGGDGHRYVGNNFNGNSVGLQVAGLTNFTIIQNDFENAGVVTGIANILFNDRSPIAGGSSTTDKGPCRGGLIQGNALMADMVSGSSCLVQFIASTAGAYHQGISAIGNVLGNRLGRSAGWNVEKLGRSMIAFNNDDVTAGPHFTGQHNTDEYSNTLLPPGGTTDSLVDGHGSLYAELTATKTWTPGVIAAGAVATTVVTVPGARAVHVCSASHDGIGTNLVKVSAHVRADDEVLVIAQNVASAPTSSIPSGISRVYAKVPV